MDIGLCGSGLLQMLTLIRDWTAVTGSAWLSAASTRPGSSDGCIDQPTTRRANRSSTTARYSLSTQGLQAGEKLSLASVTTGVWLEPFASITYIPSLASRRDIKAIQLPS